MAITRMELMELVGKAQQGDIDFLRQGVAVLAQALMDAEITEPLSVNMG